MNNKKFLERVIYNWPAKVLSLFVAIVLFQYHRVSVLTVRSFTVPLSVETTGQTVPAGGYNDLIRLTLKGEPGSLQSIKEEDVEAYIDLSRHPQPGNYKVPVRVRKKGSALGVEPLSITMDPAEVSITMEIREE